MFNFLRKHQSFILSWGLVALVLAVGISFLFPKQYSAESQVLIISRDKSGVDPYTQAKSAERIGENLSQVMKTTDFYSKVMESPSANFNKSYWQNLTDRKQRKLWQKNVQGAVVYGTSLLKITSYSASREDTSALNNAVTDVLTSRGWEYVGTDVTIRTVNTPLASRWWVRPNFILNGVLGMLVGVILSSAYVLKYKKHLFGV